MGGGVEGLFDGALRKIVRGVVAGDGGAGVGELRVLQLIDFARCAASADSGRSPAQRDNSGAVAALDERAGIRSDGPRGPLARFVRGGFSAGVGDIDWRARGGQNRILWVAGIEPQNFFLCSRALPRDT